MSSMANENFNVGGTGGALFSENAAAAAARAAAGGPQRPRGATSGVAAQAAAGEDYKAPQGLPDWKQPEYDDDDEIDPSMVRDTGAKTVGPAFMSKFFPDAVSQSLALGKAFYLTFFAAFGSLFPLLAVYFKQLGMDASQCGFLIGVRPIVEYLATPLWSKMSDRFQKGKVMLIIAVTSWIVFTMPVGFVRPPVVSCKYWNGTQYLLKLPNYVDRRKRDTVGGGDVAGAVGVGGEWLDRLDGEILTPDSVEELPKTLSSVANQYRDVDVGSPPWVLNERGIRKKREAASGRGWAPGTIRTLPGMSPQAIDFTYNYDKDKHKNWVSPEHSNEVFEKDGVHKVFFLICLLVVIGEFFSSPAVALADSAVITMLGEKHQDKYGSQRMFGSIGWAVAMFFMGMVLDHSYFDEAQSKCDVNRGQKNYHVCFYVFAFFMFLALLVATQIPFRYSALPSNNVPMTNIGQPAGQQQQKMANGATEGFRETMAAKTKVFALQLQSNTEYARVFKAMANLRVLTFMLVAWVMGIGVGLIFTFLFWHLQDFGGGPTLFGIASVLNHLSEMAAYMFSFKLINKVGHIKVLAAGLLCNCLRFVYISFITWPWLVLPFEFVQGITHAAVWAAACSFIAHNTESDLRPSAQSFLQGLYHGFGKFCGAVFGGILIKRVGTVLVFRYYGIACIVFLLIFVAANFAHRDEGSESASSGENVDVSKITETLAPHGVPSAPMPRALSSSKLEEQEAEQQPLTAGPNLGVPGQQNNPFLSDGQQPAYAATGARLQGQGDQQYYGRGYSQAQSGYSSAGLG